MAYNSGPKRTVLQPRAQLDKNMGQNSIYRWAGRHASTAEGGCCEPHDLSLIPQTHTVEDALIRTAWVWNLTGVANE